MSRVLRKRRHRRRRIRKKQLQPLSPEQHAALLAERAQQRARNQALNRQWAAEDAMYRTAAVLEGERRTALRQAEPRLCAREITLRRACSLV